MRELVIKHDFRIATRMFIAIGGIMVDVIAILTLADYFLDFLHLAKWGNVGVPMAINTAIALLIVGSILLIISLYESFWKDR